MQDLCYSRIRSGGCIGVDHDEGVELSCVDGEEWVVVAFKVYDRDGIRCNGGVVGRSFDSAVNAALEDESRGPVGDDEVAIVDEWGEGREDVL